MDIKLDNSFEENSDIIEPREFGKYLEFMDDAQFVSAVCSATEDGKVVDREVNVSITAISSTTYEVEGSVIYETLYNLCLFDAEEGGIEIAPASRELSTASEQDKLITAEITINYGKVVENSFKKYEAYDGEVTKTVVEDEGNQTFTVQFPRYYYEIAEFKTKQIR